MINFVTSIFETIEKEILWCIDNPDNKLSAEYQLGFIRGLSQSIKIIGEMRINGI